MVRSNVEQTWTRFLAQCSLNGAVCTISITPTTGLPKAIRVLSLLFFVIAHVKFFDSLHFLAIEIEVARYPWNPSVLVRGRDPTIYVKVVNPKNYLRAEKTVLGRLRLKVSGSSL